MHFTCTGGCRAVADTSLGPTKTWTAEIRGFDEGPERLMVQSQIRCWQSSRNTTARSNLPDNPRKLAVGVKRRLLRDLRLLWGFCSVQERFNFPFLPSVRTFAAIIRTAVLNVFGS